MCWTYPCIDSINQPFISITVIIFYCYHYRCLPRESKKKSGKTLPVGRWRLTRRIRRRDPSVICDTFLRLRRDERLNSPPMQVMHRLHGRPCQPPKR